jgi:tripartite-type tricarboxylate transporter receptor subunit TctC
LRVLASACVVLLLLADAAIAQTWPDKPVSIVVPLTSGSATDVMARTLARSEQLGQPFIVENKPGAAGTIGVGTVARAKPDGYTQLVRRVRIGDGRDCVGRRLDQLPQALVVSLGQGIASCRT